MTARTSENLAQVLHSLGLFKLEEKARADYYHDFLSPNALSSLELEADLRQARDAAKDRIMANMIEKVRQRHLNGEFDASKEESDAWAESEEGQEAFGRLVRGE